jgi:CheY-like chemotaxis protein
MGGRELLGAIKSDRDLCAIPVLVMTSSQDPKDFEDSYANNANFFIVKPMDMGDYAGIMKYIEDYWIERVSR